jgi:AraC-like DNA-binding protein
MSRLVTPMGDAVSDALRLLGVRSTILCISELRSPWAFSIKGDGVAKFHVVLEGTAFLVGSTAEPVALAAGDVVVLPRGATHALTGDYALPVPALGEVLAEHPLDAELRLQYGGGGPLTRLLCGGFSLSEATPGSTLELLPDVLRVRLNDVDSTSSLEPVLAALTSEAESGRPGASAVIAKIADVFLAHVLRSWLTDARNGATGAKLVRDPAIANAVLALNTRAAEPWSLDRLARHVGLSRTALATRFREATSESPMRYLAAVRLNQAAAYLAAGGMTTHEIARLTGYQNDATLSKAFKRRYGVPPGEYRHAARRPPAIEIDVGDSDPPRAEAATIKPIV